MKILIYILSIICLFTQASYAQLNKVNEAAKFAQEGNYDQAKSTIDVAIMDPSMVNSAQAHYIKGFIYKKLYKDRELENAQSPLRDEAGKALKKSLDIEPAGTYSADCKTMIKYLNNTMYNDAVKALNKQKFEDAFHNYEGYVEATKLVSPAGVETKTLFYTGYTAFMIKDYDAALKYFIISKEKNYDSHLLYFFMAKIYKSKNNMESAIEILEEGKEKHPIAKDINDLYINYMVEKGELVALEQEFKKAINLDPENLELSVTLALLYEQKAKIDRVNETDYIEKAKVIYKGIIAKDPNHKRSNYNLALLYYNKAVNLMNNMDDDDDDIFALNDVQDQCIGLFNESLPFFLKAHDLDPNNSEVLIGLSAVYWSLNNMEKSEEFKAKLADIEGGGNKE